VLPREVYFSFHPPHTETIWGWLGHVNAFGYTDDDTWFFLEPKAEGAFLRIVHRHDDVETLMAREFAVARKVIRADFRLQERRSRHIPYLGPYSCVALCGALVGVRAFTIRGLERTLLRNGGIVVHDTEGKPGSESREGA